MTLPTHGYSGTPLIKKLGIKPGMQIAILSPPENYFAETLGLLPDGVTVHRHLQPELDFIHFFSLRSRQLAVEFPKLKAALAQDGMLWISWPKKAAKVPSDLDENLVRQIGLDNGLVDVKVAAVDAVWSGLKFVVRLADRKP
jgi:hypothetical protein